MVSFNWTYEEIYRNVDKWYNEATRSEVFEGLTWYPVASEDVADLATKHSIDLIVTAGVVSALSPQVRWNRNIPLASAVIRSYLRGQPLRGHTANNLDKARRILESDGNLNNILLILLGVEGYKTANFCLNLLGLDAPPIEHEAAHTIKAVTVDRFIVGVALDTYLGENIPRLTAKRYSLIATVIVDYAKEHELRPEELQAILWVAFRRYHGVN